jgi:DNA (cytosine-5)-methyltransferase 1
MEVDIIQTARIGNSTREGFELLLKSSDKPLKVLDLFSGAGGLSVGFQNAGYVIVGGVDFDQDAISTYKLNFPASAAWLEDLESPTDAFQSWILELDGKVDVIIGGPPCQGFSIAGKRNPDDSRNRLYQKFLEIVEQVHPTAVLIENVPNIAAMNDGAVKKTIEADLAALGFHVTIATLNASHFGVPQARKRTFFVGIKSVKFEFPEATTENAPVNCRDAIDDLPSLDKSLTGVETKYGSTANSNYQELMRSNSGRLTNHELVRHKPQTIEIVSLVPDGGNYKNLPKSLQSIRKVNIAWTRMNSMKPSFTIDAGHNHHFHYSENRVPSVRECARIQSFPDDFEFLGPRTSQYRQVGNAVPPLLAQAIADKIAAQVR